MEIYDGRPADEKGRLSREIRTYDFLDSLNISYQRTDHERADHMEACNQIDAVLDVIICKNLFLCNRQKTAFYLLMMPGGKKFRTKELSAQIRSSRLSFADPDDLLKYLDIEPGAVSIMGLMNDQGKNVRLLIDEDIINDEVVFQKRVTGRNLSLGEIREALGVKSVNPIPLVGKIKDDSGIYKSDSRYRSGRARRRWSRRADSGTRPPSTSCRRER